MSYGVEVFTCGASSRFTQTRPHFSSIQNVTLQTAQPRPDHLNYLTLFLKSSRFPFKKTAWRLQVIIPESERFGSFFDFSFIRFFFFRSIKKVICPEEDGSCSTENPFQWHYYFVGVLERQSKRNPLHSHYMNAGFFFFAGDVSF